MICDVGLYLGHACPEKARTRLAVKNKQNTAIVASNGEYTGLRGESKIDRPLSNDNYFDGFYSRPAGGGSFENFAGPFYSPVYIICK